MSFFEKINWTLVLGIFAGLIVIAAAFASWNQKKKDDRESALNKQKAENAQADMRALQVENLNKTNKLANAYKKIISIQSKLINEVTGGDNKPFLMLTTTKLMLDSRSGKKYFILSFDIINKGDYSLQNVKATVYDFWSRNSLENGIKYFRDGMAAGFMAVKPDEHEKFNPINHIDNIHTITKNKPYPLYTTTFCPEITDQIQPNYQVEITWYNGSFTYFINLKKVGNKLNLDSVELLLNMPKIEYKNNFAFNK